MAIPLTRNQIAIVDVDDYELVNTRLWTAHNNYGNWYAIRKENGIDIKMHRLIMGFPPGLVDHRNRDGLDNRRKNLRLATKSTNGMNRPGVGIFKGIHFDRWTGRWRAEIRVRGRRIRIGRFDTINLAAAAYDKVAKEQFGDFAYLNFP